MFSEYSVIDVTDICRKKSISVLNKLPEVNGPQLVTSLIKPLVNLINNKSKQQDIFLSFSQDDKDVLWVMEVICYGLSLPLTDNEQYEAVRDCVNIYCEWLHALSANLSQDKFIPFPIKQNPNIYCQKIIGHLYNTFLPRTSLKANTEQTNDLISKQALICHRILRLLITIATEQDNVISAKTWECLLIFLLGINEELLKSPTDTNDIGTQIADRVISTLFQGWLISCVYFFPSPSFWRTFQNVCINSRHRPALIAQWNRVNVCLTRRLVSLLYKHDSSIPIDGKFNFAQYNMIVMLLSEEVLKQCWYRFLHIIGNPVDLCYPKIIYKRDSLTSINDSTLIQILPFIFHKVIKGLCTLVDIFLGIPNINLSDIEYELPKFLSDPNKNTPPEKRKSNFSVLKSEKSSTYSSSTSSLTVNRNNSSHPVPKNNQQQNFENYGPTIGLPLLQGNFYQNHIKLTSILDVFGKWLFQASFVCVPSIPNDLLEKSLSNMDSISTATVGNSTPQQINIVHKLDQTMEHQTDPNQIDSFSLELFEAGQAEALGALCRIFCLKKDDEDISLILSKQNHPDFLKLKNYLTSYYLALKFNLAVINNTINGDGSQCKTLILSSILVNSVHFFEVDLPGSKILVPHFFRCIEYFLSRKEKSETHVLIRRACIKILISLLSYPLHYKNLPIKDSLTEMSTQTFMSYFPRLVLLLIYGLYNETDQHNVQMILNTFLFIIEDCVHHNSTFMSHEFTDKPQQTFTEQHPSVNLMEFFSSNCFQLYNEIQKEKLGMNLFLLITSFVSDILCKISLKNSNYNISLTAIEILLALARVKSNKQQLLCNHKCSLCIRQICRFIENQCYKPAMYHSKDMHSTIVAAYQCLAIWINEHHHLIEDKDCCSLLFELIELGISGSKSKKENGGFKSDKLIKPASLRVREAAESLLTTMMGRVELTANPFNQFNDYNQVIIPCDVNEAKVVEMIFQIKPTEYSYNQFRYFLVENSLLISILDKQVTYGETVCIVRSAYGKYCFILKYQPLSHRHLLNFAQEVSIYRSLNKSDHHPRNIHFNYFPEYYEKISNSKYDNFILSVNKYINDKPDVRSDYEAMLDSLEKVEQNLLSEKSKLNLNLGKKDISEPMASKNFDPYKLILSQFEFLNFDFKANEKASGLVILNNNSQTFIEHLSKLDMLSSRMNDFVLIFYVPKDFQTESELFHSNSQQYQLPGNTAFKYFLHSLGNPISCETKLCSNIFYWNDILHELIFITPTMTNKSEEQTLFEKLIIESNDNIRQMFLQKFTTNNSSQSQQNDRVKEFLFNNIGCDIKMFILWMEKMEDFDKLPFKNFCLQNDNQIDSTSTTSSAANLNETDKYFFIVIHPLKNGLFRVLNYSSSSKFNVAPIDRILLSKQLLASYVKLTALNLFRRRRMNIESFQLPHVKRRVKIQEIGNKFKIPLTNQKLASEIFKSKFL